MSGWKKINQQIINNIPNYSLWLLLLIVFSLFLLNGGESLAAQMLFFAAPLLFLPLFFLQKTFPPKNTLVLASLWSIYLIINLISTCCGSLSLSLSVSALMKLLGVFTYWLLFSFLIKKQHLQLLVNFIIITGFLLSLVSFYFVIPQTPKPIAGMNFFYANYGHNHLASYLLLVLPLVISQWLITRTKFWKSLSLFFLFSFFLTFSRGALVILPFILLILYFKYRPSFWSKIILVIAAFLPFIFFLSIFLISQTSWGQQKQQIPLKDLPWLERQIVKPLNKEGRLSYWQQAIKGWQLRPWLGNGPGTFRLISLRFQEKPGRYSLYAHSSFLEHLSETGILGASIFLCLTLIPLIWLWKKKSEFPLLLGITALWLHSLIDFDFNFLAIWLLFWVIIASLFSYSPSQKRNSNALLKSIMIISSFLLFIFISLSIISKIFLLEAEKNKDVDLNSAANYYQKAATIFPFDQKQEEVILKRFIKQKLSLSESLLRKTVVLNQQNPYVLKLVAQYYKQHNDLETAKNLYLQLTNLEPINLQYPLELSQIHAQQGNTQEALNYLLQAAMMKISTQRSIYLQQPYFTVPSIILSQENRELMTDFNQSLSSLDTEVLAQPFSAYLSKLLYLLGLSAYQYNQPELTASFWQTAALSAPAWSYFHIELANWYLNNSQFQQSQAQLEYCLSFTDAQEACQEFIEENLVKQKPETIGFLEEKIRKDITAL